MALLTVRGCLENGAQLMPLRQRQEVQEVLRSQEFLLVHSSAVRLPEGLCR